MSPHPPTIRQTDDTAIKPWGFVMDAANAQSSDAFPGAGTLNERDEAILAFERQWWKYSGAKEQAIRELQLDMLRRMGARDAKALPPRDPFVEPARKRVQIGLLMTELVNRAGIQIEASVLEERIAEAAAQTQNPEEAEKQYRSNPQVMQQLQMAVLEEAALEWVASRANVTPQPVSFREVMNFGAEA